MHPNERSGRRRAAWIGGAIAIALACLYLASPRRIFLDARFTLLTSESLYDHASFDLSGYVPWIVEAAGEDPGRLPYQLTHGRRGLVGFYPFGSPLLTMPFVPLLRIAGYSSITDGVYDAHAELRAQALVAAALAAFTALLVFRIARHELPDPQSAVLALLAALGTGLWSVASRNLWTHSWETLLTAAAWLELLRWEDGEPRRPWTLGALLSAAFWVRPTAVATVLPITLYVLWRHRPAFPRLVAAGGLGAVLYVALAELDWGAPVPGYFHQASGFGGGRESLMAGVAGMLFSPGRGWAVYTPLLVGVAWGLARRRVAAERVPLALLATGILAVTVVLYAAWRSWWGGGGVGPRFLCALTPVAAWLGAHAWRRAREAPKGSTARAAWIRGTAIAVLGAASIAAQAPLALDASSHLPARHRRGLPQPRTYWQLGAAPQVRCWALLTRSDFDGDDG